jgi:5-formyltetrahydrofolate cyclo-ligase
MLSKNQIRIECKEKRKKLVQDFIDINSEIIINKILNSEEYKKAECVFAYISALYEVKTDQIIKSSIEENKTVLVPVIVKKKEMSSGVVGEDTVFTKNIYNIYEPKDKKLFGGKIDIIITPGLSFDRQGNRIGYGGGFFDRFFEKNKESFKIGICFDEFLADMLPREKHDVKMDMIITQNETLRIN